MTTLKKILEKPVSIIIFSSILVFFYSWPAYILVRSGWFSQNSTAFAVAIALSAFFIMFVIPAIVIKFVFKRPLKDFGLFIPEDIPKTIKIMAIIILILLPFLFFFANKTDFQQYYLINRSFGGFFFLEILASCLYFFSEEFLFRGILFFGLWDKFKYHTFWIPNLIFALFHLNKPGGEVFFAFFVGLLLSYTSFKTKSFVPAAIIHTIIALVLNIIILVYSIS